MTTKNYVLWLTGLSGSGKTTLAQGLKAIMKDRNKNVAILDGDEIRGELCKGLGFSRADRIENIRRVASVAKLFVDNNINVIVATISPTDETRNLARSIVGESFVEVFIKCPINVCEARDPKGLYKKARAGEIPNFTGLTDKYEVPELSDIIVNTHRRTPICSMNIILEWLEENRRI